MPMCECNCGRELTGKEKRFASDACRVRFWTNARRIGAGKIQAVLAQAVSGDTVPVSILHKKDGMHIGTLESPVNKAIFERLKAGPATTWELQALTGSMATSTDISAVRKLVRAIGWDIPRPEFLGTNENGRKVYRYRIVKVEAA